MVDSSHFPMIAPTDVPAPGRVRLVPLGGVGEIGMNCLAIEQLGDLMLIDCGVTFPSSDLGIDVYHPRFDYLFERRDRLRGVVITHGHEDHIGALPYLLQHFDVPVWAPGHALELIRRRLLEHRFTSSAVKLIEIRAREPFRVGSFGVEPIEVTHSIADAHALAIDTIAGRFIHTGDFKLDPNPPDGRTTDEARFAELGAEGVRLLLSDSTSIDSGGSAGSESAVAEALNELVATCQTRVVIGMFASNVQRLIRLGETAVRTGRKVALLGRSVTNHVRAAETVGRLHWPSDLVLNTEALAAVPRDKMLIIAGGTQAEPRAALARLSTGRHPAVRLEAGDRVILSSRIIPGNDRDVFALMGNFIRTGMDLVTRITHPRVHVSGHAYRDEQAHMIALTRPDVFFPVHGTLHHLARHAELAREMGVREQCVAENGDVLEITATEALRKIGTTVVGRVAAMAGASLPDEVIRDRGQLGRSGVVCVSITLNERGSLVTDPVLVSKGVLASTDPAEHDTLRAAAQAIKHALAGASMRQRTEFDLKELARLSARRAIEARLGRRPWVLVAITRASGLG